MYCLTLSSIKFEGGGFGAVSSTRGCLGGRPGPRPLFTRPGELNDPTFSFLSFLAAIEENEVEMMS